MTALNQRPKAGAREARQRWATPWWLVQAIERQSGMKITLDVCAERWSAKARRWYGPGSPEAEDGLSAPWTGVVWCNPPFAAIGPWVDRALYEVDRDCSLIWLLVPPRVELAWYHRLVRQAELGHRARRTVLTRRVAFSPPSGIPASSPSGPVELWQIDWEGPRLLPPVWEVMHE